MGLKRTPRKIPFDGDGDCANVPVKRDEYRLFFGKVSWAIANGSVIFFVCHFIYLFRLDKADRVDVITCPIV